MVLHPISRAAVEAHSGLAIEIGPRDVHLITPATTRRSGAETPPNATRGNCNIGDATCSSERGRKTRNEENLRRIGGAAQPYSGSSRSPNHFVAGDTELSMSLKA